MSKRNKLEKFAEVLSFPNTFENFTAKAPQLLGKNGEPIDLKGTWGEQYFTNKNPITLELACGRGEYTLELARAYPERNFIGVDVKGARIWKGARIALEEGLTNVAFLRTRIEQINHFFTSGEISEIWITFPDPFPRKGKANRRLTAPNFLQYYRKLLKPRGIVHLKTDADSLFAFTMETLRSDNRITILYENDDIYSNTLAYPELSYKTYYEYMHLDDGKTIKYVRFNLGAESYEEEE
ncbi:MAG: tRNA (guanosine(46)-N7)-methyltransferase TrmB [Saprospiraceae bacterium]|nr:tRNA (guanosine(46)-N7)-methyltransferase TrmB [Saprospiraceae bacterium]